MKRSALGLFILLLAVMITSCAPAQGQMQEQEQAWDIDRVVFEEGEIEVTEQEIQEGKPIFVIALENGGEMRGELYPDIAPQSVGNFIALANSGFYDGLIFHRVIPGFMIQGGDPKGTGTGGPGWHIKGEFVKNGVQNNLKHTYGVLSMARSAQADSAGSQFFVMTSESPHLDGSYAAFGKVLTGMENAEAIVNTQRDQSDKPLTPQVIKSIRVETFGKTYPFDQL